ncbi:MAG: ABC transporter ATP-binding protein [Flavobacteriales bacterium]|nr:ABC transporter ATP-binding protein [Flavobacteriales bacterium]
MNDIAIEIQGLCKSYVVGKSSNRNFEQRIHSVISPKIDVSDQVKVVALDNINLSIKKGTVLGVIGQNGSGKSTLLKLIAGITSPTSGKVRTTGRIVSILELGTGFNPELTGYQNIYFSANLLGFSMKEIKKVIDEIADFSELGEFMNVQVKYYSSGMFMRLAFSLIAWVDADIFLFDEVFSVGDSRFRNKCEDRIASLCNSGKTVVLVSHDLQHVTKLGNHFIVLDNGKLALDTNSLEEVSSYLFRDAQPKNVDKEDELKPDSGESDHSRITLSRAPSDKHDKHDSSLFKHAVSKQDGEMLCVITDFSNEQIEPKIEVKCRTDKDHFNWTAEDTIQISCRYSKLSSALVFPNFTLSYQTSGVCAAFNPLLASSIEDPQVMFQEIAIIQASCKIPSFTLNNGVFILGLHLTGANSKPLFTAPNLLKFRIGYSNDLNSSISYDGRFTGAFMPRLDWEIKAKDTN